jgi:hypothetical protein
MGFLQRGMLIYLGIAIAICMTMPSVIFSGGSPAENSVLSWFNLNYDSTTNTVSMQNTTTSTQISSGTDRFLSPTSPSSSGSLLGFVDPVYQVFSWIPLFFKVLFSPIILLMSPATTGAPVLASSLLFIIGIPATFLMIIGLIIWIRSGFP